MGGPRKVKTPRQPGQLTVGEKARVEAAQPLPEEILAAQLRRWRDDPVTFFWEALGLKLTNQQTELVRLVGDMVKAKVKKSCKGKLTEREADLALKLGISIHSGKGLGKDFILAGVSAWFLVCLPDFKGLITAPTAKQIEDIYAAEVRRVLRDSPAQVWQFIEVLRGGVYLKTGTKKDGAFITRRTVNVRSGSDEQAETLQGLHADYMCLMVDEASGVPDPVFGPLESTLTGFCNFAILSGNVTRGSGYFHRTHYNEMDRKLWECVRWNAEESDLETIKPGLAAHIERYKARYGSDSTPYRVCILGLPPLADTDALIPLEWIYDAIDNDIEPGDTDPLLLGVDVGRGGDPSVAVIRKGGKVIRISKNHAADSSVVASWVAGLIDELEPDDTIIDTCGLGVGVADVLRKDGYRIKYVNVSKVASVKDRYERLRSELYFERLRAAFEARTISIPRDQDLIDELSVIKIEAWEPKVVVESKRKMLSRGVASPNIADALMLTYSVRDSSRAYREKARDKWEEAFERERYANGGVVNAYMGC